MQALGTCSHATKGGQPCSARGPKTVLDAHGLRRQQTPRQLPAQQRRRYTSHVRAGFSPIPTTASRVVDTQPEQAGWLQRLLGHKPTSPPQLDHVTARELDTILAGPLTSTLVVVFTATWCGPCKLMDDALKICMKNLEPGSVRVVKIDVEAEAELASKLNIHKLPTLMFCGPNQGKPAIRTEGMVPDKVLDDLIKNRSGYVGASLDKAILW